jgi:hypothetical protein
MSKAIAIQAVCEVPLCCFLRTAEDAEGAEGREEERKNGVTSEVRIAIDMLKVMNPFG